MRPTKSEWQVWCSEQARKSDAGEFTGKAALMSPSSSDAAGNDTGELLWWVHRFDGSGDFEIPGSALMNSKEAVMAASEIDPSLEFTLGD